MHVQGKKNHAVTVAHIQEPFVLQESVVEDHYNTLWD